LEPAFAGSKPNLAEENLQSRLRGAMVMAYANRFGAMALTTGNKSEVAVGYCTLYGDTNGGLGPIADCYKTTVYELARHLNADRQRIPQASIDKPPSAELAPGQLDTDSLPPYPVLDRILKDFIEDRRDPADLISTASDPALVRRVIRLVELNEYKRRQSPPALRISPKAFGVGRRFPLARWIAPG
jgi:NAD+ synthetase